MQLTGSAINQNTKVTKNRLKVESCAKEVAPVRENAM